METDEPGHLFVAHGRSEAVAHDAAIVPVGYDLHFRPYWNKLLGEPVTKAPPGWRRDGWGRAPGRQDLWLVSVGGRSDDVLDEILSRIDHALREIKSKILHPIGGRFLPLVAVPVVGISGGGYGEHRGQVVDQLVKRLDRVTDEIGIDAVLVSPDPAVYAAAQYARRKLSTPLSDEFEERAKELGHLARDRQLALFLGAGVSIPAGLPSWADLIEMLGKDLADLSTKDLKHLTATDQAEIVEKAAPKGFQRRVANVTRRAQRPALLHALLAGLDCREVVTTNYDLLYEQAVLATGRKAQSIMPWDSALGADRWVLKLHGDIKHVSKIVLTRRHMVRYDASNRPSGALLQSLLLTRHLLFVGASLTDDNVIRLAHEVEAYREEHKSSGAAFGTVLDANGDRVRGRLWLNQLHWIDLPSATDNNSGYRALELFLDRVAHHASRDSSWLLDQRFEGLLSDPLDRERAASARALLDLLPSGSRTKWGPLVTRLEELGARSTN